MDVWICIIGVLFHFTTKWGEDREASTKAGHRPVGMFAYLQKIPAQAMTSVLGTAAAFLVVSELGWMNPGMAFGAGYMGNSIAVKIANKFSGLK